VVTEVEITILISNLLVTIGLFLTTLYRVRIEKRQIDVLIKNAESAEKMKLIRKALENDKNIFLEMSGQEIIEFLEKVCNEN